MTLDNRVAILTGAKRLGRAVALDLATQGADIGLVYRGSGREAAETAAEVESLGRRAALVQADLARPDECRRAIDTIVAALGRLDVLVNMASIYRPAPLDTLTEAAWNEDLDINLRSAYLCSLAAVPHLRRAGGGRIINFSDWLAASGRPQYPGFLPYYVAKRGVIALTEALALELAPDNVLVNAVAPGPIAPPPDMTDDERHEVAAATPLGRWGGEAEIVKTVRFLIASDFVTGETVRVDGGRHVR